MYFRSIECNKALVQCVAKISHESVVFSNLLLRNRVRFLKVKNFYSFYSFYFCFSGAINKNTQLV